MTIDAHDVGAVQPAIPAISRPSAGEEEMVHAALSRRPKKSGLLIFAFTWLVLVCVLAIAADWLPLESFKRPVGPVRQQPGFRLTEPFGTDSNGRSQLSRVIYGGRISLAISVLAVALGMTVGGIVGTFAGFFRGVLERVVNVVIDSLLAFPSLVLLLAVTSIFTPSFTTLVVALAVLSMPAFARLARAATLSVSQQEFVLAARGSGERNVRIVFSEIMPNVITPVTSYAFIVVGAMMVAEGSLSFLGLGVPPPQPSWGGMIAAGRPNFETHPWLVFIPALILLLTVFSLTVVGDWARLRADRGGSSAVSL